jgi:hypothetical protein
VELYLHSSTSFALYFMLSPARDCALLVSQVHSLLLYKVLFIVTCIHPCACIVHQFLCDCKLLLGLSAFSHSKFPVSFIYAVVEESTKYCELNFFIVI